MGESCAHQLADEQLHSFWTNSCILPDFLNIHMTKASADVGESHTLSRLTRIKVWLILAALSAHLPLLSSHFLNLWNRPHYRFLPILLGVCVYLLWQRLPRRGDTPVVAAPILSSVLLVLSLLLLASGIWLTSPVLGAASAIFATGFLIISFVGVRAIDSCIGVWALMWVLIPPPLGYDLALISQLQAWTSSHASDVLDLLGIDHLMSGNVLTLADTTFFVDEACSGVHSLFALFGFTAVFVVFTSRGLRRGLLLLFATVPWALFLNMLRIVTIAVFHTRLQIDLSSGWPHEVLGFITFVIALLLTLSTDQLLGGLGYMSWTAWMSVRKWVGPRRRSSRYYYYYSHYFSSRNRDPSDEPSPIVPVRPARISSGIVSVVALSLYVAIGVTQVTGATNAGLHDYDWSALADVTEQSLPKTVSKFGIQQFETIERDWSSDLGRSSRIWNYANPQQQCVVSVDYPFFGWHELSRCYRGIGWQLQQRTVHSQPQDGWHLVEATFTNESGEHAFLVYGSLNQNGAMLVPPSQLNAKRFIDRVRQQSCVQVQAFSPSSKPISEQNREDVRELFRAAIQHLKPIISKSTEE